MDESKAVEKLMTYQAWHDALAVGDYKAMRQMMRGLGYKDGTIDTILRHATGSPQRFIWWQSLLRNTFGVAVLWGIALLLSKALPWFIPALMIAGLTAGEYWQFRKATSHAGRN